MRAGRRSSIAERMELISLVLRQSFAGDSAALLNSAVNSLAQARRHKDEGHHAPAARGAFSPPRAAGLFRLNRFSALLTAIPRTRLAAAPIVHSTKDPLTFTRLIPTRHRAANPCQ